MKPLAPALAVLALMLACAESGPPDPDPSRVTRAEMGPEWPLTTETAEVGCDDDGRPYVETGGGTYGLTGFAAQEYGEIDPVWADNPAPTGGPKVSLYALTERARALCP